MLVPKKRFPIKEILIIGLLPSAIKKMIYRSRGYKIGHGVSIGLGAVIIGKDVEIGSNSSFGFFSVVKAEKIKVGHYVKIGASALIDTTHFEIGDDSRINEQVFVGGIKTRDSLLKIGKRAIIMQMSFINPTLPIEIGDDSGIGGHCLLFTHGSWNSALEGFPVTFAPIKLGKKVWLPWRVFILPGVEIGDNAVIGADSTVNKSIPAQSLAAGSPAKVLKHPFPSAPSVEDQRDMLRGFFKSFKDHIEFIGASIEEANEEGNNITFTISLDNDLHHLYYFEDPPTNYPEFMKNNVILNWTELDLPGEMVLRLNDPARRGTSKVGEELTVFLSRYGIRFNRTDV